MCSVSLFIYDEEVTIRRKYVLDHFILQQLKHIKSLVLILLPRVALRCPYAHLGRCDSSNLQSTTDEDCMFLFNWF